MSVNLDHEGSIRVGLQSSGCSISCASASVLFEQIDGTTPNQAWERLTSFEKLLTGRGHTIPDENLIGDGIAFAGVALFPARVKCALLPWMGLKDALARAGLLPENTSKTSLPERLTTARGKVFES